jgi:hypothetical protein
MRFWVAIRVKNQAQSRVRIWVRVRVRNQVRSYPAGEGLGQGVRQEKNMQGKGSSLLRVRDLFVHGTSSLYETIQQGDKVESKSNKKGQSELKEGI